MKIESTKEYEHFGELEKFPIKLQQFFQTIGNDKQLSSDIATIVQKITQDIIKKFNKKSAWICIRTVSHHAYKIYSMTRWHVDGYYHKPFIGPQYKVAFTLKGPSTLFYKLPDHLRKEFYETSGIDPISRKETEKLIDPTKVYQPSNTEGVIFMTGDRTCATAHSEPIVNEDRIFISVFPGTHEQIKEIEISRT